MRRGLGVVGPLAETDVWERYAVPARWSEWAPQIRAVDTAAGRIAPGVRGRVRGPLGVTVSFLVTAVDEQQRTWSWDVRLGLVRMHLQHGVASHPRGTATWLNLTGPAPAVLAYLPVAYAALRRLVRP